MSDGRRGVVATVAWRLLRAPWVRQLCAISAVITAGLVTTLIAMNAWTLSPTQAAERDFGRFAASVDVDLGLPPGRSVELTRLSAHVRSPDTLLLFTDQIRLGEGPSSGARLIYQEADWGSSPFPGIQLTQGRWPAGPGEVVIAGPDVSGGVRDQRLNVLSGAVSWRVVGQADDAFGNDNLVLAAPGTWAQLPRSAGRAASGLSATPVLLLSSEANVASARQALPVASTVRWRREQARESSWLTESPFAFGVPAALLPLLGLGVGVAAGARRARRFAASSQTVGLSRGRVRTALFCAFGAAVLVGSLVGGLVGLVGGVVARQIVGRVSDQAVGPWLSAAQLGIVPISMLAGLVGGISALRLGAEPPTERAAASSLPTTPSRADSARRWAALLSVCAAFLLSFWVRNASSMMIFGIPLLAGWLLVLPDAVRLVGDRLNSRDPARRLAGRLIRQHGSQVATGAALSTALLTCVVTTLLLLTATGSTARANSLGPVGAGQVGLSGPGGLLEAPAPEVAAVVRNSLAGSTATPLVEIASVPDLLIDTPQGNTTVLALSTPDEVERLLGTRLTPSQRDHLQGGGALTWQPEAPLVTSRGDSSIPLATYTPTEEWANLSGAVLLTRTATARGFRVMPGGLVATGVDSQRAQQLRDAVTRAGLDSSAISLYRPPRPLLPPAPMVASGVLLTALLLGITFVSTRAQTAGVRRQMERLLAIGARPRFARRTQLVGQSVATGLGLIGAVVVTGIAVSTLLLRNGGIELRPPYEALAASLVAFIAAQLLALWLTTRNLQARATRDG